MYSLWRHTLSGGLATRIYRYVMAGSLILTSFIEGCLILFRNISLHQAGGKASITRVKDSMFIDIPLARPWKIRAGQYVNLWMPLFSMRSLMQSHPFMVVYWTEGTAPSLYFLVQPQDGLTRAMYDRAHQVVLSRGLQSSGHPCGEKICGAERGDNTIDTSFTSHLDGSNASKSIHPSWAW